LLKREAKLGRALKRSPVSALISVDVVVIAVLQAFAVEQVGNAAVCDLRVVPQQIGRFLRTANLNDADLVVVLIRT
jgi:hypothetical protein